MSSLNCEKCGAAMGLAETFCHACGTPAPAGRASQILRSKAEAAFEQGQLSEAVRQLAKAVEGGLPEGEMVLACRKLGLWQEKLYAVELKPELLSAAENSYRKAIAANDADDIAHQLYIACAARLGRMGQAAAFYQERLAKNPEDAVAKKQLTVIKLTADIKAAPAPAAAVYAPTKGFGGFIERALKPTPWKVITLLGGLAVNVFMMFSKPDTSSLSMLTGTDGIPASALDVTGLGSLLGDPKILGLQVAITLVILFFMYRNR